MSQPSIDELALKHGTDKASSHHNYTATYQPLFEPLRHQPITLLELGYLHGASARTWREYFTHATIIAIDNDCHPTAGRPENIYLYKTDQADHEQLTKIHYTHGDYNIIIDDASHISSKTIASFEILWPMLKPGGHYIVEDTHGSYHSHYYGHREADENPNTRKHTTMWYFKRLVDDVNYHDEPTNPDRALYPRRYWRGHLIDTITFKYNLIHIQKGVATL